MSRKFLAREPVLKVRKGTKQKVSRTYKRLEALSEQMGRAVTVDLVKGITAFKKRIDPQALLKAWATRDYHNVIRAIPWPMLPYDLQNALNNAHQKGHNAAMKVTIPSLPAPMQKNMRIDAKNPRIISHIDKRSAEITHTITADAHEVIRQAVTRHLDRAMSPTQIANNIKGSIGLTPRLENAVANYEGGLQKSGMASGKVDRLVDGYRDELLTYRSKTIARSETRSAVNRGQLSVWHQAADQDLLDRRTAQKVWIVDGAPCEVCAPMDGEAVPLDEFWTLNDGSVVEVPSDSHPNCMCGMELSFGDMDHFDDDNEEIEE